MGGRRFFKGTDHLKPLSMPVRVVAGLAGIGFLAASVLAGFDGEWTFAWIGALMAVVFLVSAWKGKDFWDNPASARRKPRK